MPASLWNGGFKVKLLQEISTIKVGSVEDYANFLGPVMCVKESSSGSDTDDVNLVGNPLSTRLLVISKRRRVLAVKF